MIVNVIELLNAAVVLGAAIARFGAKSQVLCPFFAFRLPRSASDARWVLLMFSLFLIISCYIPLYIVGLSKLVSRE